MHTFLCFWISWKQIVENFVPNTSITLRCGALAIKLVLYRGTESDRELARMAEHDLKALHISKYQHKVSTIISKIQDLLATLRKYASEVLEAACDDCLWEDYRLHIKMCEMKHNQDKEINLKSMTTDLEAKCCKLVRQKSDLPLLIPK